MGKTYKRNDAYSNKYVKYINKKKLKVNKSHKPKTNGFDQPSDAGLDDFDPSSQ